MAFKYSFLSGFFTYSRSTDIVIQIFISETYHCLFGWEVMHDIQVSSIESSGSIK